MKNIGIVRRLDELGRIVIPREFRKTHRINVGDPLEITATENGSIVISKVDHISDLVQLAQSACNSLASELNVTACACSFEKFVCAAGGGKSAFLEKDLPAAASKLLKNRGVFNGSSSGGGVSGVSGDGFDSLGLGALGLEGLGFEYACAAPIISYDDCFGGIFVFSPLPVSGIDAASIKLAGKLVGDALQRY